MSSLPFADFSGLDLTPPPSPYQPPVPPSPYAGGMMQAGGSMIDTLMSAFGGGLNTINNSLGAGAFNYLSDSSPRLAQLISQGFEDPNSLVGPITDYRDLGNLNQPLLTGLGNNDASMLDRLVQGVKFGHASPYTSLGPLGMPLNVGVAGLVGGANEISKMIPGGQDAIAPLINWTGLGEGEQFRASGASSKPSMRNLMALLAGTASGSMQPPSKAPQSVFDYVASLFN